MLVTLLQSSELDIECSVVGLLLNYQRPLPVTRSSFNRLPLFHYPTTAHVDGTYLYGHGEHPRTAARPNIQQAQDLLAFDLCLFNGVVSHSFPVRLSICGAIQRAASPRPLPAQSCLSLFLASEHLPTKSPTN